MISLNNYNVYIFRNIHNGKIYVGQSCNIEKRCSPCNYKGCKYFYQAIQKYGWNSFEQIIIKDGLSKELADIWEKKLISFFNSTNDKFGYNLSLGGTHMCSLVGKNNGFYKKKHTEESIKTMQEKKCGGNNPNAKPVLCVSTNTVFPSAKEASDWCGASRQHINRVCRGERKHTGLHPQTKEPLKWRYINSEI